MEKDEKNAMKGLPLKTMAFLLLLVVTFFTSSCRQKEVYTMLYYDLKRLGSFLADNGLVPFSPIMRRLISTPSPSPKTPYECALRTESLSNKALPQGHCRR